MRRHGWTFGLGLLLTGLAAAQPPASEERYPPAPDLPGEVVGQLPAAKPPADAAKDGKPIGTPAAAPLPDVLLAPFSSTATTTVAPVDPGPRGKPMTAAPAMGGSCPVPSCRPSCCIGYSDIKEWLCFRSKAQQTGHFVTPYRPPLLAWFPCESKAAPCGVSPVVGGHGCAMAAPAATTGLAGMLPHSMPDPDNPGPIEAPLAGGTPIGKCLDSEVLTTFQPLAPGLGFAPGAAPMANPTTQVKPTSWKAK